MEINNSKINHSGISATKSLYPYINLRSLGQVLSNRKQPQKNCPLKVRKVLLDISHSNRSQKILFLSKAVPSLP